MPLDTDDKIITTLGQLRSAEIAIQRLGQHARDLDHRLAEAVALLRAIEWIPNWEEGNYCSECLEWQGDGHKPNCALAKILRENPIS